MSASCCGHDHHHDIDPSHMDSRYRRVLWAVLALNAAMFAVEISAGVAAGSASLQADALDFKRHGRIILSSLERNKDGGQWIHWQRCYGDLAVSSAYGAQGTGKTGTSFPGMGLKGKEVTAAAGTAVMFVEISYDYQPLLYGKWLGARRISTTAAFNIREPRDLDGPKDGDGVYNPSPAATKSAC